MSQQKYASTSALAKQIGRTSSELFSHFLQEGWINKSGNSWELTDSGKSQGGIYKESKQYGRYIAWPESIVGNLPSEGATGNAEHGLSSTSIGKQFSLAPQNVNAILSELGWVKKGAIKGWVLTDQGRKIGGDQKEHHQSGAPYVNWPASILENKSLLQSIEEFKGDTQAKDEDGVQNETAQGFRDKFEAKLRTTDGHYVRSKAEMLIDNWLYMAEIVHAYERKLPVEEEVYCDFYIPTGKLYIEYWGYENEEKYLARKQVKKEIYSKYDFPLIELNDADVQNLDDILPAKLLKFGIKSY